MRYAPPPKKKFSLETRRLVNYAPEQGVPFLGISVTFILIPGSGPTPFKANLAIKQSSFPICGGSHVFPDSLFNIDGREGARDMKAFNVKGKTG